MPSARWKTGALALAGVVLWGQSAPPYVLRVLEGDRLVAAADSSSSRRLTVELRDAQGRPVPGATISFRLPSSGPAGVFASGLSVETFLTGADGRAWVQGIRWSGAPGPAKIRVTALWQESRTELEIPVEISAALKPERLEHPRGGPSRKTWLIAAGVAGGVVAALLAARARSGAGQGAAAPLGAPVSIGNPTITLTRP
jgi:hypothetical protein